MSDPYQVLQVSSGATDDEVKAAYRELARKYHPDNYNGNPLSDLATEKMQAINEAYDMVMEQRRNGTAGSNGYQGSQSQDNRNSQFSDIRRLINTHRITEAEELLDGVPKSSRDAEWFFLKGCVQQFRGWLDDAYENYATACNMEPSNGEYKNAFSQLQWQRQRGRPQGRAYGSPQQTGAGGCSICDVCTALYCANCFCNCLGGGGGC